MAQIDHELDDDVKPDFCNSFSKKGIVQVVCNIFTKSE